MLVRAFLIAGLLDYFLLSFVVSANPENYSVVKSNFAIDEYGECFKISTNYEGVCTSECVVGCVADVQPTCDWSWKIHCVEEAHRLIDSCIRPCLQFIQKQKKINLSLLRILRTKQRTSRLNHRSFNNITWCAHWIQSWNNRNNSNIQPNKHNNVVSQ